MVLERYLLFILAKQKNKTNKSSSTHNNSSNGPQKQIALLTNEIKFDRQIDIPNPKLQPDGTLTYSLFGSSSNIEISPSGKTNNAYYPELEKLSKKLDKTFKKKGTKYLLKKQNELNDTSIQMSIASANGRVFLAYTKPDAQKTTATNS
jgi:hypothetical protein